MKLSFHHLAILTSLLFLALALVWMFEPQRVLVGWGIAATSETDLVGRRAAALYAGIAVMFWLARNASASLARSAMSKGLAVASFVLASLGIFELAAGHVRAGILAAVVIELLLALALLHVSRAAS
ncbi:hypothetical protein ACQ4WY_06970 [Janthinobacterium sp. LB2P49]|uniref:hypothetical protein n=1 Tax=Janthinobacterium sp. LB2P49 TaxID=3424198 RepID=UPI003F23404D